VTSSTAPRPPARRRVLTAVLAVLALLVPATAAGAASPPRISAPSAIVMDAQSGDVAYARQADEKRPIASTTKLMTALLALEAGDLKDVVTAPRYHAAPAESVIHLVAGERMTEADLLRGLLVYSANDAAYTIAQHVAGSEASFVRRMNRRAQQLGLKNTHYANPIGLDQAGNYSTARDLAKLTMKLRKYSFFRRTVNEESVTLKSGSRPRTLANRNTLLADAAWVDGVKTGHTSQAGDVLVASGHKRGVRLISAVLGEPSKVTRNADSLRLLNYGFTKYHLVRAIVRGDTVAHVPIDHRAGATLPLVAAKTVHKVKRPSDHFTYRQVGVPTHVDGPVHYGTRLGTLEIMLGGRRVASVPLTAALEVPAAGVARKTQDFLTTPWTLVVLGVVLLLAALVASRRRPSLHDERPRRRTPAPPPPEEAPVP
jgi:serine-type D-Ala-D-Ala carboxypeptidase (penicillin-binding protein 5/6)